MSSLVNAAKVLGRLVNPRAVRDDPPLCWLAIQPSLWLWISSCGMRSMPLTNPPIPSYLVATRESEAVVVDESRFGASCWSFCTKLFLPAKALK